MAEAAPFIGWRAGAGPRKARQQRYLRPHFDRSADISAELRPGRPDPASVKGLWGGHRT